MNIEKFLQQVPLLKNLSPENVARLAYVSKIQKYPKKSFLFHTHDDGNHLFVVCIGKVKLFRTSDAGKEIVVTIVQPPEIFAEVILFEERQYPVTAQAIDACTCILIERTQLAALLDHIDFRNDFIAMQFKRQRFLVERLHTSRLQNLQERLFMFLKNHYGPRQSIKLDIPKKDLAAAIGSTPETLSRIFLELQENHICHIENKRIIFSEDFWQKWQTKYSDER